MFFILLSPFLAQAGWIQRASFGGEARHRCTAFSVGNKGYIGGGHINSGVSKTHADWWQYDPASDTWMQIADFGGGPRYHSSAFGIGEFGYVGLGEDANDNYYNDFWRYIPQINIWEPIEDYPGLPRRGAASFVLNGRGYVGTGQSDAGYQNDFYRYNPNTGLWVDVAPFPGQARSSAVGFAHNGKGYVGTGHIWGDDVRDFYAYDPVSNSWAQKADVGPTDRQDATGFVVNGYGYIGTGNDVDGYDNYDDFWRYDFALDTWTQISDFDGAARRYMVGFVINDVAYGGTGTDGTNLKDFWSFHPTLDIKNPQETEFVSYPNPSADYITIQPSQHLTPGTEISIYSQNGALIKKDQLDNQGIELAKDDLGTGVFLLVVTHENKIIHTSKIQFI